MNSSNPLVSNVRQSSRVCQDKPNTFVLFDPKLTDVRKADSAAKGCAGGGRVELFFSYCRVELFFSYCRVELFFSCYSSGFGFQGAGGAGCAGSGRVEVFSSCCRVELFSFCYSFGFGFQGAGGAGCAGSGRVELFSFYC
ncbi:hypothetical protein NPIL_305291 [Nephila pilipes]|uniref:Uncharacterized protein n=1 Tax=Nephila pilipes TaxID=299642 RepID=A0A8X6N9W3_NEPPI|nr:hypothetical protein NPIL_305291 [Nephila pilipes]